LNDHEDFQLDLPAYAASRLEGAAAKRLEDHLKGCASCREMADTLKEFAGSVREGGEALFEPHPAESKLMNYARGSASVDRDRIERHLRVCATCSLEVESWKRHADRAGARAKPISGGWHRWRIVALASAAGLVIGFSMARMLRDASAPAPAISAPPDHRIAGPSAGALLILPRALRGGGAAVSYRIDSQQDFVVIASQASIPELAGPEDRFRFEIRTADGQVVWSREMSAANLREQLDGTAEAVTLLVPAHSLQPGRYVFKLSPADKSDEVLYRTDLEIVGSP